MRFQRWATGPPSRSEISPIPPSLTAALDGVNKIYLASGPGPRQVTEQHNLIEAARHVGVKHVARISTVAVEQYPRLMLGRWHGDSEAELEASGMAWTHLRPCNFMHNMLSFAPAIRANGSFSAPLGRGHIALVDVEDIAEVAVVALTEDGHTGKTYELTGGEWLTYHEVADQISAAIGRTVSYVDIPPERARRDMLDHGVPLWLVDDLLVMYELLKRDTEPRLTDTVAAVTGRAPKSFFEFLAEHSEAFTAA